MRISFIGSGNLATNLGKALKKAGYDIVQVYSPTLLHAKALASTLNAQPINDITTLTDADVYIFSVKDKVLEELVRKAADVIHAGIVIHTAGSMPLDVFKGKFSQYGVFYPMQTFSKQKEVDFTTIPCFIEANCPDALKAVKTLAQSISQSVYELSTADRRYLHLAAVFACNFSNHCYTIASEILSKCDVPFTAMLPLIEETTRKLHVLSPNDAQTGPAVRYDKNVIDKQLALLSDMPMAKDIYELMTNSIHTTQQ